MTGGDRQRRVTGRNLCIFVVLFPSNLNSKFVDLTLSLLLSQPLQFYLGTGFEIFFLCEETTQIMKRPALLNEVTSTSIESLCQALQV